MKNLCFILVILFSNFTFGQWVKGNGFFSGNILSVERQFNYVDSSNFNLIGKSNFLDSIQKEIDIRYNNSLSDEFKISVKNFYETENGFDFDVIITDAKFYTDDVFFSQSRPKYGYFTTGLSNVSFSFDEGSLLSDIKDIFYKLNNGYGER